MFVSSMVDCRKDPPTVGLDRDVEYGQNGDEEDAESPMV